MVPHDCVVSICPVCEERTIIDLAVAQPIEAELGRRFPRARPLPANWERQLQDERALGESAFSCFGLIVYGAIPGSLLGLAAATLLHAKGGQGVAWILACALLGAFLLWFVPRIGVEDRGPRQRGRRRRDVDEGVDSPGAGDHDPVEGTA
ncbi:MAG: hypothetical protein AB7N76_03025 [Planctomycetota bacterium]